MRPRGIQRLAPLTPFPTPGINTAIKSTTVKIKILGANRSQVFTGTLNTQAPTAKAIDKEITCLNKKKLLL